MATEGNSGTAAGGQLEERTDFTIDTDLALAQCASLLEEEDTSTTNNNTTVLSDVLQILYTLEKRCRVGNDPKNLVRICRTAIQACYDRKDYTTLIVTLNTIATKRSQKVAAIREIVTTAIPWCIDCTSNHTSKEDDTAAATATTSATTTTTTTTTLHFTPIPITNDDSTTTTSTVAERTQQRNDLIVCLRDLTHGKLFLERERAQLTRAYAAIQEEEGNIAAAADVLQEVHVETYGSLSKKEKVEYILEQLRLTICKQDYVRAAIVAGKINRKHLNEMLHYKIQFYTLLSTIHRHDRNELELVKDYHAIYLTHVQNMKAEEEKNGTNNNNYNDNMTSDMDIAVTEEADVMNQDEMLDDSKTITTTTTPATSWQDAMKAVIVFLLLAPYSNEQQDILNRIAIDVNLEKLSVYPAIVQMLLKKEIIQYPIPNLEEIENMAIFKEDGLQSYWHDILYRRVIQHNIRIVAMYYTRIHGKRLGQLLRLSPDVLEEEIASMVSDGTIYAKIDRPADIIRFQKPLSSETILTNWATQIEQLLHLVDTTTHLIHKEQMTTASSS